MDASRANSRNQEQAFEGSLNEENDIHVRRRNAVTKTHPKNRMVERTPRPRRRTNRSAYWTPEDCGTKDKILKECAELFYENFEQTLDEKTHLMGFNSIFDLNKNQFRKASQDLVSMCGHRL
jgi:hypothetical protein